MSKYSIIIPVGAYPEPQEEQAAKILAEYGAVEFILPMRTKGVHTPDVFWLGKAWEIKTPTGKSRWRIKDTLRRAVKQSSNIVIDLRYIEQDENICIEEIQHHFELSRVIRHLKIITKSGRILDFKR